jgi:hypothetical protein
MRERIREAVDHVALEAMVEARRTGGQPHPAVASQADRVEFEAGVRLFLERLQAGLAADLTAGQCRRVEAAGGDAALDPVSRLVAAQAALAHELPDYWQRFEAIRAAHVAERAGSRGERRGVLRRLLGG